MDAGQPLFDLKRLGRRRRSANEAFIRGLCESAYLGDRSAICRVLGRYKMFVDTDDVGLSAHLMLDGYWEMWLTEALAEVIKPGMTVVDVGANLGYFTLLAAECVGGGGAVHAFEPNPPIAARLVRSVNINGFRDRVTVHAEPLGSENGREVVLAVPGDDPKNAKIVEGAGPDEGHVLEARRFDNFPELLRADVIKIDAEGAELDIWHGMSGLLELSDHRQTIFLEFTLARYPDPAAFLSEIAASGFRIGELTLDDGMQPRSHEDILSAPQRVDQMLVLQR